MPLYDQEKMAKLVSEFRKSVSRLQKLKQLDQPKFLSDPDKIGSAKYHFIVVIESCIDMCNHNLIADFLIWDTQVSSKS